MSQKKNKSAKATRISAKKGIYQPKQRGYEPKKKYISQSSEDMSQKKNKSAKATRISAKKRINQPKQ
ncbi:hypothetical protein [Niallia sp.]|uniref:hypothetical protein n=1 Tax=Niallia sp. TaxID=2837523 RepID=UPI00289E2BFC|nr:hypothetical protein [Niallia sp.]